MLWHQPFSAIQILSVSQLYQDTHTHTHTHTHTPHHHHHTIPQMICGGEVRYRNKLINLHYSISGKDSFYKHGKTIIIIFLMILPFARHTFFKSLPRQKSFYSQAKKIMWKSSVLFHGFSILSLFSYFNDSVSLT